MTAHELETIFSQVEVPNVVEGEHRQALKERLLAAHADIPAEGVHGGATPKSRVLRAFNSFFSAQRRAVAAAIVFAFILGGFVTWDLLNGRASVAWAAVEETLQATPWVHTINKDPVKGTAISECWYQSDPPGFFMSLKVKGSPGYVFYADYALKEEWVYQPAENIVTIHTLRPENEKPRGDLYLQLINGNATAFPGLAIRSVQRGKSKDGITPFDVLLQEPDKADGRKGLMRVWVDDSLKLPVRAEAYDISQDGKQSGPMSVCEIDYPQSGPADIYAAGVPRDAKIMDARPAKDVARILAEYDKLRETFPKKYKATVIINHSEQKNLQEIWIVSRDGPNYHLDCYTQDVKRAHPEPLTFDEARTAIETGTAELAAGYIWGKDRHVSELYRAGKNAGHIIMKFREPDGCPELNSESHIPEYIGWPSVSQMPAKRIASDDLQLAGLVGIQVNQVNLGVVRKDQFWFNPQRDSIADRRVLDPYLDGKPWLRTVTEYAQLPSGHWYPRHIQNNLGGKPWWDIWLEVAENPALPPDTFNAASLRRKADSGMR
jgi:hypothetical protein